MEKTNLEKLQEMLKIWLEKNQLDDDLDFYSIQEWKSRGEDFLNKSELVVVFEGGLYGLLNRNNDSELYEEFEDLIESFGYYYELGHSWNLGFYEIPNYDFSKSGNLKYSEKLKDLRWKTKSKFVRRRANGRCEDCGKGNSKLEVHHCYYKYQFEPWEYPFDSLRCLCVECHKKRSNVEWVFRSFLASLKTDEIELLHKGLDNGMYWFERKELFKMIGSINSKFPLLKKKEELE